MSGKIPGAILILSGAFLLYIGQHRSLQKEIRLLEELHAALENMETEIRWKKTPLPQAMEQQTTRPLCGLYFLKVLKRLKGGTPLQSAWQSESEDFMPSYIQEILRRIEWNGDERQLTGNLHAAQDALLRIRCEKKADRLQREKVSLALALSGAGLMILILI